MTLVYRDSKYQKPKVDSSLGPGSYNCKSEFSKNSKGNDHFFVSSSERIKVQNKGQEIGPGTYNTDNAYNKIMNKNLSTQCKAIFKSKVERFFQNKQNREKSETKLQNVELLLGNQKYKSTGKLYGIIRDKKKLDSSVPSIPSCEQSFGYRIDANTNKLILNQNPNILLAKKEFLYKYRKINDEEKKFCAGNYFIKNNKSELAYRWGKQTEQKVQNSNVPDFTTYNKEVKWNEKGNRMNGKEQRFSENKGSKKQKLLINMMHKKFHDYIEGDFKDKENLKRKEDKTVFQKNKQTQCFLSKEDRLIKLNEEKTLKGDCENYHGESGQKQVIKQSSKPFWKGEQRFKIQTNKQAGPGTYNKEILNYKFKNKKNVCLKLTEERFKKDSLSKEPGPGSYQLKEGKASNGKRRANKFTESLVKIVSNSENLNRQSFCLKNKKIQPNEETPSMSFVKVKVEKNESSKKNGKWEEKNIIKQIKEVVRERKEGEEQKKQNGLMREKPKQKIMIYNPVDESPQPPGPGSFEIERSFLKKTFNVTYT